MPIRSVDVDSLVMKIHSAALAPDGWNSIGNDIRQALNAEAASGLRVSSKPLPAPWGVMIAIDPNALADYVSYWEQHDVWYQSAMRNRRISAGLVSTNRQLIEQRELEGSPFFNEFLRPADLGDMMNVCLAGSEGFGRAVLNFYRGFGSEPFSPDDVKLLSHLAPHLTVAAHTYWTAQSLRMLEVAYRGAIDMVTSAVVGIAHSGRVSFMNRAAEELVRKRQWFQIVAGELAPIVSGAEAIAITTALHRLSDGFTVEMLVTDPITGAQAVLRGASLPDTANLAESEGTASLAWITPVALTADIARDMAMLFALTPAETRLINRLVLGDDLRTAAMSLHISLHTARTQLKAIFGKTGKRTQGALLSFAAKLSALRTSR